MRLDNNCGARCVGIPRSHQQGKETPAGFETKEQQLPAVSRQVSGEYLKKREELRKTATNVTTEILRQAQTNSKRDTDKPSAESLQPIASARTGRLVSGDSFIASTAKRTWLRETFHADAVDMVSGGHRPRM